MDQSSEIFVGIDVSKARNATAIAEGGRDGEVRYLGEVEASEEGTRRLIKRMGDVLQSGLSAVGAHCLRGDRSRALTCRRTDAGIKRRGWGDVILRRFEPAGIKRFTQGRRTDRNAR